MIFLSQKRCDGKAEDLGLKDPELNPQPRQEKVKNIFSLFLVGYFGTYEICLKVFAMLLQLHVITNIHS